MNKIKNKREFPHVFIILIIIMLVAYVGTLFIPSGLYERIEDPVSGRMLVDPSSFKYVQKEMMSPSILLTAIPKGMIEAAMIMVTIFIIGGSWEIIHRTGTISSVVSSTTYKMRGKEILVFPILMFTFAFVVSLIGALELSIVFLPAVMPLILAFGFDLITAAGCVLVGACSGFAASITNSFTVGISHSIAGLEPYSGMWLRALIGITFFVSGCAYVISYANKVRENPKTENLNPKVEIENKRPRVKVETGGDIDDEFNNALDILLSNDLVKSLEYDGAKYIDSFDEDIELNGKSLVRIDFIEDHATHYPHRL